MDRDYYYYLQTFPVVLRGSITIVSSIVFFAVDVSDLVVSGGHSKEEHHHHGQGWSYRNWDPAPPERHTYALIVSTFVWWWIFHGRLTLVSGHEYNRGGGSR